MFFFYQHVLHKLQKLIFQGITMCPPGYHHYGFMATPDGCTANFQHLFAKLFCAFLFSLVRINQRYFAHKSTPARTTPLHTEIWERYQDLLLYST